MHKRGDTLIEVALAIGIFSMVAITVVSVVSASTSGAQSSLELTLTREDLDSQAEALRFIHDSYVTGTQSAATADNPYAALWNQIASLAVDAIADNLNYSPQYCNTNYQNPNPSGFLKTAYKDKGFIINPRKLGTSTPSDALVYARPTDATSVFYEATTFPRIYYGGAEDLYSQERGASDDISRVEGIYILAVKGTDNNIATGTGGGGTTVSTGDISYYDFYIRSCWMPAGSDHASTISTVVRLYDPAKMH